MYASRVTLSLMFLLVSGLIFGQKSACASEGQNLCNVGSLPQDIQSRLKEEYGSWKVQEPADLSKHAHERWESEKPLGCPGIAMGHFESGGWGRLLILPLVSFRGCPILAGWVVQGWGFCL